MLHVHARHIPVHNGPCWSPGGPLPQHGAGPPPNPQPTPCEPGLVCFISCRSLSRPPLRLGAVLMVDSLGSERPAKRPKHTHRYPHPHLQPQPLWDHLDPLYDRLPFSRNVASDVANQPCQNYPPSTSPSQQALVADLPLDPLCPPWPARPDPEQHQNEPYVDDAHHHVRWLPDMPGLGHDSVPSTDALPSQQNQEYSEGLHWQTPVTAPAPSQLSKWSLC